MATYEYYGPRGGVVPRVPPAGLTEGEYQRGVSMHGAEIMQAWYRPTDSDFHKLYSEWVGKADIRQVQATLAKCRGHLRFDFEAIEAAHAAMTGASDKDAPDAPVKKKTTRKTATRKTTKDAD